MTWMNATVAARRGAAVARIAWPIPFAAALALLVLIWATAPANVGAATTAPGPGTSLVVIEEEGEEEEKEEEPEAPPETGDPPPGDPGDSPPIEEEAEELEEETSPFPPDECLLRTARARVFAYTSRERVRLVIRYTSLAPAQVTVAYRLEGAKGSLKLGTAKQRFAKKGLFRLNKDLSKSQIAKVKAAKGFTVQMRIPAAPSYCNLYYSRHLTIKRTAHNQLVWFQSDSIFGTAQ